MAVCSTNGGHSFAAPVHLDRESADIALPGDVRPNSEPSGRHLPQAMPFTSRSPNASRDGARRGRPHPRPRPDLVGGGDRDSRRRRDLLPAEPGGRPGCRVAISAFALANGRVDEVLLLSRPRELRFGPPLRVTTAAFDPLDPTTASAAKYGAWWIGDWQGIAAAPAPSISCGTTPAPETRSLRGHGAPMKLEADHLSGRRGPVARVTVCSIQLRDWRMSGRTAAEGLFASGGPGLSPGSRDGDMEYTAQVVLLPGANWKSPISPRAVGRLALLPCRRAAGDQRDCDDGGDGIGCRSPALVPATRSPASA